VRLLVVAILRFIPVYRVEALSSVGVPLMVQVALSILKPVGSAGATAQLAIQPISPLQRQAIATLVNFRHTVQQRPPLIPLLPVLL
jgi:hypothetical protein